MNEYTVKEILEKIENEELYLPLIQRNFVWKEDNMCKLMDSLMQGYPIGMFYFWKIEGDELESANVYVHNFIKNYSEFIKDNNDDEVPLYKLQEKHFILNVLDGQQRITTLNICFNGSIKVEIKKTKNKLNNYLIKHMCLNIQKDPNERIGEDLQTRYEFKFLTDQEINNLNKDSIKWYKVNTFYENVKIQEKEKKKNYFSEILNTNFFGPKYSNERDNLETLYRILVNEKNICTYEVTKSNMFDEEDILNIFTRMNSSGKKLSKSDFLFSIFVNNWEEGKTEIKKLISDIDHQTNSRFIINNDFIMKTALFLVSDDFDLKIQSIKKDSIHMITQEWENIKKSIWDVINMLYLDGFEWKNIISYNSIIPLIYFVFKCNKINLDTNKTLRNNFIKFISYSIILKTFSKATTQQLKKIRICINNNFNELLKNNFYSDPFLKEQIFIIDKNSNFFESILDEYKKNDKGTRFILLLLSENFNSKIDIDIDHIHPQKAFNKKNYESIKKETNWTKAEFNKYKKLADTIPNLQLLSSPLNKSKGDMDLSSWINETNYKIEYDPDCSYEFRKFPKFYKNRRKLMLDKLKEIL